MAGGSSNNSSSGSSSSGSGSGSKAGGALARLGRLEGYEVLIFITLATLAALCLAVVPLLAADTAALERAKTALPGGGSA